MLSPSNVSHVSSATQALFCDFLCCVTYICYCWQREGWFGRRPSFYFLITSIMSSCRPPSPTPDSLPSGSAISTIRSTLIPLSFVCSCYNSWWLQFIASMIESIHWKRQSCLCHGIYTEEKLTKFFWKLKRR